VHGQQSARRRRAEDRWLRPMAPAMPVPWDAASPGAPTALKRCATTPRGRDGGVDLESITAIRTLLP
jgi:hypothetical protein